MNSGFLETKKIILKKTVNGTSYDLRELMATITRITKTIGSYKKFQDCHSVTVAKKLREVRQRAVREIKIHFGISWKVKNGRSVFTSQS